MSDVFKFMPTALAIVALVLVVGQCRKPRGWVGRFYAWLMGVRHTDARKGWISVVGRKP